jgi:hypothetical protein
MSRLVPVRVLTPEREGIVQRPDWRLERMASIVEGLDLGEEWDAERHLIEQLNVGPVHLTGQDISGATVLRLAAT